jgi:RHS repeat-associated protein
VAANNGDLDERTFGAHPFDAESGLYYMQRRHYDPATASFLRADPIAVLKPERYVAAPRAYHPYAYCGNDPVNNADPDGMSFWSVLGAIAGVIAGVAIVTLAVLVPTTAVIAALVVGTLGLMTVSYVGGSLAGGSALGQFIRGFSIGLNAGLNAMLGSMIFGPIVGIALGVVNFLAAFDGIAGDRGGTYQAVLGWSSWLMPMSWLATGVGLGIFLIDVVAAGLTGNRPGTAARINSITPDWGTGAIVTHGGVLSGFPGGYTPGNFVYINAGVSTSVGAGIIEHELGHTLNNAAFGSIWHFVGWIDENAIQKPPGDKALAERLAESHDPAWVTKRWVAAGAASPLPWWALMWR